MAEKDTRLSIVIRTVDQATAKIKAINEELDKASKPVRDFKKQLGELAEKSGLSSVAEGFKGVGEAVKETLFKFVEATAIVGEVTHLVLELVDSYDELGKKASRIGVGVDWLAQMRFAAEKTGVPVEALDASLQAFNVSLGQARAGTGQMAKFVGTVSPALLAQLKATKSNAAAFDLLAGAMAKVTDPAKRAALAQKTLGDSALGPLFAKGPKGIQELREQYLKLAGSQEGAVASATETKDSMIDLHAATDRVKAALVTGLSPALKILIDQLTEWLEGHSDDIKQWAEDIGKKLPDAVHAVVDAIRTAVTDVMKFVDAVGGLKNVAIGAGLILAGPLIGSVLKLSGALLGALTNVGRLGGALSSLPGAAGAGGAAGGAGGLLGVLGPIGAIVAGSYALSNLTGGPHLAKFAAGLADRALDPGKGVRDLVAGTSASTEQSGGFMGMVSSSIAPDVSDQARAAASSSGASLAADIADAMQSRQVDSTAKITVDFANAPRGTRVTADPQSTADVDLSVGYQLGTP